MIKAIVTDIEGTTSSLSFVKEVLFPYARTHIADFLHAHHAEPEVAALIDDVQLLAGTGSDLNAVIRQLICWIDSDQKVTPLKSLQGLIWEAGYRQGDFKGHVYDDAVQQLRHWRQLGLDLYVYSSGSVYAQKLLFAHTAYGDLTALFTDFFDTHIGGKKEAASYQQITERINFEPAQILFLSDIVEELDAASEAGLRTVWLVRDADRLNSAAAHRQVRNFLEISPD